MGSLEEKSSIQGLRKEAFSELKGVAVCAGIFVVSFAVFRLFIVHNADSRDWIWVFSWPFVIGMLWGPIGMCIFSYKALEMWWMIRQIKRGVDVDRRSNVLYREGAWTLFSCACPFSVATVVFVVYGYACPDKDNDSVVGFITGTFILGSASYIYWREALRSFGSASCCREAERKMDQSNNKVIGRLP